MIDPTVRPLDSSDGDDLDQLALLEADARAALVGERGGDRWLIEHPAIGEAWQQRSTAPGIDVVVAHVDAVVVGYLVAILGDDRIVRVDQFWVDPQARENGFGDALLELAIERARENGAVAVEGQSLPGDR
ncbi:MAG: GNAT family N-acetyltransferase, partial [Actinomycetota bacterium]